MIYLYLLYSVEIFCRVWNCSEVNKFFCVLQMKREYHSCFSSLLRIQNHGFLSGQSGFKASARGWHVLGYPWLVCIIWLSPIQNHGSLSDQSGFKPRARRWDVQSCLVTPDCFVLVGYSVSKTMFPSLANEESKRGYKAGTWLVTPDWFDLVGNSVSKTFLAYQNLKRVREDG